MNDLISVIVPVYNVEKYLDKCLNSIVNQTYKNIEIIIIDDGSTDSSTQKCDEWEKKDSRINVIHQVNMGLSEARNVGILNAKGKYISFVDSDDYLDNKMLEKMYFALIKTNSEISFCRFVDIDENKEAKFQETGEIIEYSPKEALVDLLREVEIYNFAWNKLYKKELFVRNNFP